MLLHVVGFNFLRAYEKSTQYILFELFIEYQSWEGP